MANAIKKKVRLDSNRIKLLPGESQRENGTYDYRWTTEDGIRHSIYATTLSALREAKEKIYVDNGIYTLPIGDKSIDNEWQTNSRCHADSVSKAFPRENCTQGNQSKQHDPQDSFRPCQT